MYNTIEVDKDIKSWSETETLEGYDITFIGFPIEMLGPSPETQAWLAKHVDGKRIALIITHGSPEDAPPLQEWLQKCRDAAKGADIVGLFHCRGDMSDQLIEGMLQSGNLTFVEWAKLAKKVPKGYPDEETLNRARVFVQEIIGKK